MKNRLNLILNIAYDYDSVDDEILEIVIRNHILKVKILSILKEKE